VLVERSGLTEAEHSVSVAVADSTGSLTAVAGPQDRAFFARSVIKPFQATVAIESGAVLAPEELAVACASHDGNPVQVALVEGMLRSGGLSLDHLRCPPARPLSSNADRLLASRGRTGAEAVLHNCSGKHAAMLLASEAQGWDLDTYLDPDHPLQRAIAEEVGRAGAVVEGPIGVDGCGSVTFPVSVGSLAKAFASLVGSSRYRAVAEVMHRYPALVSGVGNHDAAVATELHAAAKRGAEATLAVGVFGFGSIAIKIWDGGDRAVAPVLESVLDQLGWVPRGAQERLGMLLARPVFGGGHAVGALRARVELIEV
jgi:L-asparaginase II